MRAPEFWNHRSGPGAAPLARLMLEPMSWLYQAGAGLKASTTTSFHPSAAVVCVGNITMGGTGKTPVAIALMERLRRSGVIAHALTRGYGGRKRGPLLVDPDKHEFRDVGDEALLLARAGPTWMSKSKIAGARAAVAGGAQVIVMDDGFQNRSLAKDLSLLVIDAEAGLGNGRVFPAGPLRESARAAMRRADAVILMGGSGGRAAERIEAWRAHLPNQTPVLRARLAPKGAFPLGPVLAFAGIGRPQKFFDALTAAGAELKATATFADHHAYAKSDIDTLREAARRHNALLLTTEKDHVRLPRETRRIIHAWPVAARFEDEAPLDNLIERALDRAAARR